MELYPPWVVFSGNWYLAIMKGRDAVSNDTIRAINIATLEYWRPRLVPTFSYGVLGLKSRQGINRLSCYP